MLHRPLAVAARHLLQPIRSFRGLRAIRSRQIQPGALLRHEARGTGGSSAGRRAVSAGPTCATTPPASAAAAASMDGLLQALAIPPAPDFRALGARVEHVLAPRDGLLSEIVTEALRLPEGAAQLLLRFGAIHTCPVPPPIDPRVLEGMAPEAAQEAQAVRQEAQRRAGNSSQARTPQRMTQDGPVAKHAYIRVHLHPKRFPAAYTVNWKDRIVANGADYVVVSKPAGVPAAPTIDNLIECAPACAAQAAGHPQPLLVTSRLDQCTEGLLVLGKCREFVQRYNELVKRSGGGTLTGSGSSSSSSLGSGDGDASGGSGAAAGARRPLRKFYRAASAAAPPLGLLRHWLSTAQRRLGLPSFTLAHEQEVEGGLLAELRVLEVRPVRLGRAAAQQFGAQAGHECLIELLTGRTHQIRAQLSAAGCPLLGDALYQPLASAELRQRLAAGPPCGEELRSEGGRLLEEPAGGIALQACRLEVADACVGGSPQQPAVFEVGTPWWRDEVAHAKAAAAADQQSGEP